MSTEMHNRMVWDGRRTGHFEAWTLAFNHRASGTGLWIRYELQAPLPHLGPPSGRIWFAFFDADKPRRNVALNRGVELAHPGGVADPWRLELGGAVLTHESAAGEIVSDAHAVRWDLRFEPSTHLHRYLPEVAYRREDLLPARILAPNAVIHVSGTVTVDGRTLVLAGDPGCQTHLWGSGQYAAWALAHCTAFREDATAALQVLSIKPRPGWLAEHAPRVTMVSLYLGGEVFDFSALPALLAVRGRWDTGLLRFAASGNHAKVEGELRARPEDLVRAEWRDPDGEAIYCHATEVADAMVTVWARRSRLGRFRQLCRLTSRAMAHLEHGGRQPDAAVDRRHELVGPR